MASKYLYGIKYETGEYESAQDAIVAVYRTEVEARKNFAILTALHRRDTNNSKRIDYALARELSNKYPVRYPTMIDLCVYYSVVRIPYNINFTLKN